MLNLERFSAIKSNNRNKFSAKALIALERTFARLAPSPSFDNYNFHKNILKEGS